MADLVSVIVVSRHRLAALRRCILALRQQDFPQCEVIVVADPGAIAGLDDLVDIKKIPFDQANISAARNLGLNAAAGQIAAFIDDDAVAEPTWLSRLIAPFEAAHVVASTGFVRARNGISYQWSACEVDVLGADHPLECRQITLFSGTPQRAVKTQGTNCAFRTSALREIGGFDPNFRFYLDEADVNLRMGAQMGAMTAVVPDAQVHHGYLASERRDANRVPTSLFEIAASTAVFLRRHAEADALSDGLLDLRRVQGARMARFARDISPSQIAKVMATLDAGWQDGLTRPLRMATPMPNQNMPFLPLIGPRMRGGAVLAGRIWARKSLMQRAGLAADAGQIVTVICLSPTLRAHRMQFTDAGIWLQTGGIWGRADRSGPRIIWGSLRRRLRHEVARIARFRPV